ncbi:N-acetylmuramic acid 6-phosphate etherase [Arcanobacterium haemolyticum]|nr:N-acetylmuramic acid 6-phosphate etherase [Arcanobacterium haemolyticum]
MTTANRFNEELSAATTEKIDPRYRDLDLLPTVDMVRAMNEAEAEVSRVVSSQASTIASAVDGIAARMRDGGRLIYVGAGTPGRLGVLDASECPPTFSTQPGQVMGIIAGGQAALTTAIEGAEDDAAQGDADVRAIELTSLDTVVGITASGRTPYVLGAIDAARSVGALTVGVSSNHNAKLSALVDFPIEVVVGPEIIAGSTRLKAGSAQKQVLNILSTLSMIKLGKTYGNLMVDVSATNAKLLVRAENLVMEITGVDRETAAEALSKVDNHVKTAVVCIVRDVDPSRAKELLDDARGSLRVAISGELSRSGSNRDVSRLV